MTQPPHLEESTILMCKEETAWVETRIGCAQWCQAATRWQAVLGWRKKEKEKKTLSGVSRVPDTDWGSGTELKALLMKEISNKKPGHRKRRNRATASL